MGQTVLNFQPGHNRRTGDPRSKKTAISSDRIELFWRHPSSALDRPQGCFGTHSSIITPNNSYVVRHRVGTLTNYIVAMTTGRLEAFSDGVIAILITIMVLAFRVPHETSWRSLAPLLPLALTYVLSFVIIGIYWNNHHHLLGRAREVTGTILWANLHLLFWLSLFPFATGWMGENHFASVPVTFYGLMLLGASIAFYALQFAIVRHEGPSAPVTRALGGSLKAKLSVFLYISAICLSLLNRWIGVAIYFFVAAIWFVPDRRLERVRNTLDAPPDLENPASHI